MSTRTPIEYNVVQATGTIALARNVFIAIQDGFEPIGGVAVSMVDGRGQVFYQAVVKYEGIEGEHYQVR
jgi:hypothetical protein